jgi:hypothetical protein
VPISEDTGLPNRLVENKFWDVIGRLWRAAHFKEKASSFDQKFFQNFLKGQVVERKEANWNVSLYIRVCGNLPIREEGWDQLVRLAKFLSQHGRLTQPWRRNVCKWIKTEIIPWVGTKPYGKLRPACESAPGA